MIGPATPQANLAELAADLLALARRALDSPATPARDWRARLRCALADATLERCRRTGEPASVDQAYGQLISDTTAGRIPPGPAAVVHARVGRAHAAAGEPNQAIDSWRRAPQQHGLGGLRRASRGRSRVDVTIPSCPAGTMNR